MPSQYEVMYQCPKTGQWVSTGTVVPTPTFTDPTKHTAGAFNCPVCGEGHAWTQENARIQLVHR